jgi:hypothetical protein
MRNLLGEEAVILLLILILATGSSVCMGAVPDPAGGSFTWDTVKVPVLNVQFPPTEALRVADSSGKAGLLLTGDLIKDYWILINQKRLYGEEIAGYKRVIDTLLKMSANCDTVWAFMEKRIAILQDIARLSTERGDLYQQIAEASGEGWLVRFWHSISFHVGLVAGIVIGVIIAQ